MCLILEAEVYGPKTDYFGKMKVTKRAEKSVEDYLQSPNIQAKDYFLEDEEHFNIDYPQQLRRNTYHG